LPWHGAPSSAKPYVRRRGMSTRHRPSFDGGTDGRRSFPRRRDDMFRREDAVRDISTGPSGRLEDGPSGASREVVHRAPVDHDPLGPTRGSRGSCFCVGSACRSPRTHLAHRGRVLLVEGRALRHTAFRSASRRHHGRHGRVLHGPVLRAARPQEPARASVLHASGPARVPGVLQEVRQQVVLVGRFTPGFAFTIFFMAGTLHTRASTFFIYDFAAAAFSVPCWSTRPGSSAVRSTGSFPSRSDGARHPRRRRARGGRRGRQGVAPPQEASRARAPTRSRPDTRRRAASSRRDDGRV